MIAIVHAWASDQPGFLSRSTEGLQQEPRDLGGGRLNGEMEFERGLEGGSGRCAF